MTSEQLKALGLDDPKKFPNLQAFLINLAHNVRACCAKCGVPFVELSNDQAELTALAATGSTTNRTAGWGC